MSDVAGRCLREKELKALGARLGQVETEVPRVDELLVHVTEMRAELRVVAANVDLITHDMKRARLALVASREPAVHIEPDEWNEKTMQSPRYIAMQHKAHKWKTVAVIAPVVAAALGSAPTWVDLLVMWLAR